MNNGTNRTGLYIGAIVAGITLILILSCARRASYRRTVNRPPIVLEPTHLHSPVRYQTSASLNNRAGAHILPLHSAQTWTPPAPPYSPPTSPPPPTNIPMPAHSYATSPSFPVPVHARNDPQMFFPMPMPPHSPASPAEPAQRDSVLISPPNTPSNLVDRMREVQGLMLEIHRLENEPDNSDNNEKIQELQKRVAQLSRMDANNTGNTVNSASDVNDPPPYFPPPK